MVVNEPLAAMGELFAQMHEVGVKGELPRIVPEEHLQAGYAVRS